MEPERDVKYELTWDSDYPVVGDTAHLKATLIGYEGLTYTLQWQMSLDREQWTDVEGENDLTLDIHITSENNNVFWRLTVYVEEPQE